MRELLLLRHGKAERDSGCDDLKRPLKDKGKRGAQRIGVWLLQHNLVPDLVISSPAERALTSAEKCAKVMGIAATQITQNGQTYGATGAELIEVLAACSERHNRVLLVGHNPGLEELLTYLSDRKLKPPRGGKLMPTATLARLLMPNDWTNLQPGCAEVTDLIRKSALPKRFPFPSPDGKEFRGRPAYYYSQSSVIPYRIESGQPEILIISSSQGKHWVVPKGITEPGLTPEASALKEAREEAGIEGIIAGPILGEYVYEKWGAQCTVSVFPMLVTQLLPQEIWQESHRGREWVSAAEAANRVKQPALKPMIMTLEQELTRENSLG